MSGMAVRMKDPTTGEEFSFSPARCIERFYPQLIAMAIEGFRDKPWEPWYETYLQENGVSQEDLFRALRAFSILCETAVETDKPDPRTVLAESGFFDAPKSAQLVVLAKIGQLCAGAFWAGIRHSVMVGVVPEPVAMIQDAGAQLERFISETWDAVQTQDQSAKQGPSIEPDLASPPSSERPG